MKSPVDAGVNVGELVDTGDVILLPDKDEFDRTINAPGTGGAGRLPGLKEGESEDEGTTGLRVGSGGAGLRRGEEVGPNGGLVTGVADVGRGGRRGGPCTTVPIDSLLARVPPRRGGGRRGF